MTWTKWKITSPIQDCAVPQSGYGQLYHNPHWVSQFLQVLGCAVPPLFLLLSVSLSLVKFSPSALSFSTISSSVFLLQYILTWPYASHQILIFFFKYVDFSCCRPLSWIHLQVCQALSFSAQRCHLGGLSQYVHNHHSLAMLIDPR